jgi:hypothetical protein
MYGLVAANRGLTSEATVGGDRRDLAENVEKAKENNKVSPDD